MESRAAVHLSIIATLTVVIIGSYHRVIYAWLVSNEQWTFLLTWDDDTNFRDNDNFKQPLLNFLLSGRAFESLINVWEPASWTFKCIVWNIAGLSSLAYRMSGIILHGASSIVLFWTLRRMLHFQHRSRKEDDKVDDREDDRVDDRVDDREDDRKDDREEDREDDQEDDAEENRVTIAAAYVGSMWYAVHPLNVEVICWPSALPYALAGLFHILSLFAYTFVKSPPSVYDPDVDSKATAAAAAATAATAASVCPRSFLSSVLIGASRLTDPTYAASIVLLILSICSKSAALLAAPAGFLAIDMIKRRASHPFAVSFRWLFYAVSFHFWAAVSSVSLLCITLWANVRGMDSDIDVSTVTDRERIIKAPMLVIKCISDVLFPIKLRPHYMLNVSTLDLSSSPECVMSICLVPMFCFVIHCIMRPVTNNRSNHSGVMILVWFFLTILPVLGIVQHGYVCFGADRLWHFVLIPLSYVVSSLFAAEWRRSNSSRKWLVGCTIVILFGLSITTMFQTSMWQNDETLWIGSLKVDKTDWRAADQLVEHYIGTQSWEKARPHLDTIQMFSPQDGLKAELHKAKLLLMQGLTEDACMVYKDLSRGLDPISSSSSSASSSSSSSSSSFSSFSSFSFSSSPIFVAYTTSSWTNLFPLTTTHGFFGNVHALSRPSSFQYPLKEVEVTPSVDNFVPNN